MPVSGWRSGLSDSTPSSVGANDTWGPLPDGEISFEFYSAESVLLFDGRIRTLSPRWKCVGKRVRRRIEAIRKTLDPQ